MSEHTVAMAEPQWDELVAALDDDRESAAVLLAGEAETRRGLLLTINRVVWVPDADYELRTSNRLQIASPGWMPALRVASDGKWLPIFFHTHPGGSPASSKWDDLVDSQLATTFRTRIGASRYASLILGGTSDRPRFSGRVFERDADPLPIARLRVAGRRLRIQRDAAQLSADDGLNLFDRQIRAFGADGQQLLQELRVGVVGCGGTGSAVLEQLTRLGVGSLTFADDDVVTPTNITRIYGSTLNDVDRPKVDVLRDHLARIGLGTELRPITGNITRREIVEHFRDCDLIFGCTDDDGGRGVLSRLAYWYLIPIIDMAVVLKSNGGFLSGIYGRVTTATPGEPCLLCRGEVDPVRAREEQYSPAERQALIAEGYAPGLAERDPAVIAYTTMVAAQAVGGMLQRLFGFGATGVPGKELLQISDRRVRGQGGSSRDGCYCATGAKWGRADSTSPLGMTWPS